MAPEPGDVYQDDPSILDNDLLYRMIKAGNTKWVDGVADRAGTNAFQDRPESDLEQLQVPAVAVSIYIGSELAKSGRTPADLVGQWGPDYGVAAISAGTARGQGQGILRWPLEDGPEHGMVFVLQGPRKTGSQSKSLAKQSEIVIPPPPAGRAD